MQKRYQLLLLILAGSGLVAGAWIVTQPKEPSNREPAHAQNDEPPTALAAELPPVAASRFVNTSGATEFIGTASCAQCHPDEHASYLRTPHSRALSDIDLQRETWGVEFKHPHSSRKYEVLRKEDRIWHRETLLAQEGSDIVLAEHPVDLAIGSGHHSRSYLVATDGFLLESPITWYASKKKWAMSPGYDVAHSPGFERVADLGCVHCHAGRVESVDGSRFRVKIHDQSIGCESCHGPGSLHAARRQGDDPVESGSEDVTIVNPAHLTRIESEAICARCHLRGDASVDVRGRSTQDFRPGLRLHDFRADYVLEQPEESMKVVGHVEQMKLSRCYQETETLTCTTCHDPHDKPAAPQRLEYFRQKCLACHALDACGLEHEQRVARDAQDNCVACHMPQSPTDIPHFAFTHHRVAIHQPQQNMGIQEPESMGRLLPLEDLSHLPQIEQLRCLGLANLEFSDKQSSPTAHDAYRQRAVRLLERVSQQGLRDGDVEASLARVYWEGGDLRRAVLFASESLTSPGTSGAVANAKFVLGDSYLAMNQPDRALGYLQELVRLRRQSEDWVLLGICQRSTGQIPQAISSLEQAAKISPTRVDIHVMLAELYQHRGDPATAANHRRIASLLQLDQTRIPPRTGAADVPVDDKPRSLPKPFTESLFVEKFEYSR